MRSKWNRIILTLGMPAAPAAEAPSPLRVSPSDLVLDLGAETAGELRSARLSSLDPDEASRRLWQRANRVLKGMTSAGAFVVNLDTGDEGWDRNQRFTVGAEAFFRGGRTLRAFAGANVYRIGAP